MGKEEMYVIGLGASAGGHDAIKDFFQTIPANLSAAFVIVTHLHRNYRSELASIVSRFTKLKVQRINGFTKVRPGFVYVMPENVVTIMNDGVLHLRPRSADLINKSIDIFFESLAENQKELAIGIVLSGMGSDGAEGAVKIFENGGIVMVQEPSSTAFNSMPWSTIMKDHPDFILPPAELGTKVVNIVTTRKIKVAS